jgi:hypothetical protein
MHECRWKDLLVWDEWIPEPPLRRREARRIPVCAECGAERPERRPRRVERMRVEAARQGARPSAEPDVRRLAALILRRARGRDGAIGTRGLLSQSSLPASRAEECLDGLLFAGWTAHEYRVRGSARRLERVHVRDPAALEEFADPGGLEARRRACDDARAALKGLSHPVAEEALRVLAAPAAEAWEPDFVRALAAVAMHAAAGDVLAERAFSAARLGDSKALPRLRGRIERLLGPLASLGLREGAALSLVGGSGRLVTAGGALDLAPLVPFVGLSRETIVSGFDASFPPEGLLLVENLAPFEACARGEVPGARGMMVVWSGGYPGRAERALALAAARAGASVCVWADLDLDGVRIARLVTSWAPAAFFRMSPGDVAAARVGRRLTPGQAQRIEADLAAHPEVPLADTLRAILHRGEWIEQEAWLTQP